MFRKVLIANRGEIAVRIMRTLREMQIPSVAIYSDADKAALHTRYADEAVHIGPSPSTESYLDIERILHAAKTSGADAIHPGYGFLSESAAFAEACSTSKLTFIGPNATAIASMGSKVEARKIAQEHGVPVVPGCHESDFSKLAETATHIGFPVLLKASAGGGGKGMRLVHSPDELKAGLIEAQREAGSAFGDDKVYIEKAIIRPRHIEVQLVGDTQGNLVHLFERDCSIQRRHQKIIEETPGPSLAGDSTRLEKLTDFALKVARAVNYHSTGTVEFLEDATGEFYFLEMNTRLQVEHPITELVTGTNLVREQIRIAAGKPLSESVKNPHRRGHAIECRIYAENTLQGFIPSPGRVTHYNSPEGPGVRHDSGIHAGHEVTSHYDPLISKLCVLDTNRNNSISRMKRALDETTILGLHTNLSLLGRVMEQRDFRAGTYATDFIDENLAYLQEQESTDEATLGAVVASALAKAEHDAKTKRPTSSTPISSWRKAQ